MFRTILSQILACSWFINCRFLVHRWKSKLFSGEPVASLILLLLLFFFFVHLHSSEKSTVIRRDKPLTVLKLYLDRDFRSYGSSIEGLSPVFKVTYQQRVQVFHHKFQTPRNMKIRGRRLCFYCLEVF